MRRLGVAQSSSSAAPGYCVGLLTPASLAGPIAVRSTQFGAGEAVFDNQTRR
jgi:hypothetical protein